MYAGDACSPQRVEMLAGVGLASGELVAANCCMEANDSCIDIYLGKRCSINHNHKQNCLKRYNNNGTILNVMEVFSSDASANDWKTPVGNC